MEREWSLARYREFNDRLARRVEEMEHKNYSGPDRSWPRSIREKCDHCGAPAGTTCAKWNEGLTLRSVNERPAMTAIGQELDHDLSELERRQAAKLLISRLHRIAAEITGTPDILAVKRKVWTSELYELANEIEERLSR